MFRKIHSNRNPQDTILSELKRLFRPYVERWSKSITRKIESHSNLSFVLMILLMVFSLVLSFTVFRNREPVKAKKPKVNVIGDGFDQISSTAKAIRQTLQLKQEIDSLTAKKTLTKADSDLLDSDLNQLQQLNQYFKR